MLANTAVLYRRQDSPDPAKIAAHVERMRGLLLREVAYGFGAGPSFAVMACVHGHADEAIDVLDELLDRGLWQNPDVLWTLADAGHRSRDVERKRRVVARVTSLLPSSESPFARAHLARIHAALGDPGERHRDPRTGTREPPAIRRAARRRGAAPSARPASVRGVVCVARCQGVSARRDIGQGMKDGQR